MPKFTTLNERLDRGRGSVVAAVTPPIQVIGGIIHYWNGVSWVPIQGTDTANALVTEGQGDAFRELYFAGLSYRLF
jgi:hypothetical protein